MEVPYLKKNKSQLFLLTQKRFTIIKKIKYEYDHLKYGFCVFYKIYFIGRDKYFFIDFGENNIKSKMHFVLNFIRIKNKY